MSAKQEAILSISEKFKLSQLNFQIMIERGARFQFSTG